MYCPKCGKELKEGTQFCSQCGAQTVKDQGVQTQSVQTQSVPTVQMGQPQPVKQKSNSCLVVALIGGIVFLVGILVFAVVVIFAIKNAGSIGEFLGNWDYNTESTIEQYDEDEFMDELEKYIEEEEDSSKSESSSKPSDKSQSSEVFQSKDEYLLPGSDSRYLSKSDLIGMTKDQCRIARNEIYARHGRIFKDQDLQNYFSSCSWYVPRIQPDDFQESMLNAYEIANRDLIVQYETEQGYR